MKKITFKDIDPSFIHNLSMKPLILNVNDKIEDSDFPEDEISDEGSSLDLRMKASYEKRKNLVNQIFKREENKGLWNKETNLEETANYIIDYMPLCFDEDFEMYANAVSKENKEDVD